MSLPLTLMGGSATELSVTESCHGRSGDKVILRPCGAGHVSIMLSFRNLLLGAAQAGIRRISRGLFRPVVRKPAGVYLPSASYLHHAAGPFVVNQFFMSAAMRSCAAFLMASDRFNPGGNFLACARASAARAAQSCLWRSLLISSVMSSSLLWRPPVAVLPADKHRTLSGRLLPGPRG